MAWARGIGSSEMELKRRSLAKRAIIMGDIVFVGKTPRRPNPQNPLCRSNSRRCVSCLALYRITSSLTSFHIVLILFEGLVPLHYCHSLLSRHSFRLFHQPSSQADGTSYSSSTRCYCVSKKPTIVKHFYSKSTIIPRSYTCPP